MPSKKPRIGLTVSPEVDEVLTSISKMLRTPKTKIINEFLDELLPVFKLLDKSLKEVDKTQKAMPALARFVALSNDKTADMNKDFARIIKQQDWVDADD